MILMDVFCVWLDPQPDSQYVVILKEKDGARALPMTVGVHEARAIQWALDRTDIERPMTHDLLTNCIRELGAAVERVEIRDYRGGTYYASIVLEKDGVVCRVDARPSDGTALALRCDAPIFAAPEVLEAADATLVEKDGGFVLVAGRSGTEETLHAEDRSEIDEQFRRIMAEVDLDDEG